MRLAHKVLLFTGLAALVISTATTALPEPAGHADTSANTAWHTSWAESQDSLATDQLHDQSIRSIARLSQGGDQVRIRIQNQFGEEPLVIDHGTVAISSGSGAALESGTVRRLTFGGDRRIVVPVGGQVWSDPAKLSTRPQTDLAISLFVSGAVRPGKHGAACRDNYLGTAGSGDHVTDTSGDAFTATVASTYLVSAVDVRNPRVAGTIVAYGSSVVDGQGSTDCGTGCTPQGTDHRWTDDVARRIIKELPADRQLAIANAGVNGTTSAPGCPNTPAQVEDLNAPARLDRDVLALHGVTGVIYFYGTNDLQNNCTSDQIIASYRTVFERLHKAGIDVYVVPSTPRPIYTDQMNRYRWDIGTYVTNQGDCGGDCDGVIEFDQVIKDPVAPNSINPSYDVGDGIHVNIDGQQAEAGTVSLRMLSGSAGS